MLKIITGKPGSGKSYYAIKQLLKECDYDPIARVWDKKNDVQLICSIDGCKFNHKNFDSMVAGEGTTDTGKYDSKKLASFFDVEKWEEITKGYKKTIIVIDEAQRYFPSHARDLPNSIFFWFEYHRHYGIDIILLTQHPWSLHRRLLNLVETYIEAQPSTMRLSQSLFKYRLRDTTSNEVVGTEVLKTEQIVFDAYKSARHDKGLEKPKSLTLKYAIYLLPVVFIVGFSIYKFQQSMLGLGGNTNSLNRVTKSDNSRKQNIIKTSNKQTGNITRSIVARWTIQGVTVSDFELLPSSCEILNGFVRCPPFSLPPEVMNLSLNKICNGNGSYCFTIFPLSKTNSVTTDTEQLSQF